MVEQKITELLEEKFQEEEYKDCYVIDVELYHTKLKVFIDCDNSLSLGKCQRISRFLESHLDEQLWLGEKYLLEVSSPGIDRPLKFLRQYKKNLGRTAEVHLKTREMEGEEQEEKKEAEVKTGKLVSVKEDRISIEAKVRKKVGKKKKTIMEMTTIPFEDIEKTIIKISFKK